MFAEQTQESQQQCNLHSGLSQKIKGWNSCHYLKTRLSLIAHFQQANIELSFLVALSYQASESFFSSISFYWSLVALHCCVSFYESTYIPSFLDFLPIQVTTEHWVSSLLYRGFSLVVYFIRSINSVYVSTPVSQFIPLSPFFPLGICMFILYICVSTSALQKSSSVAFF